MNAIVRCMDKNRPAICLSWTIALFGSLEWSVAQESAGRELNEAAKSDRPNAEEDSGDSWQVLADNICFQVNEQNKLAATTYYQFQSPEKSWFPRTMLLVESLANLQEGGKLTLSGRTRGRIERPCRFVETK